jgi:hypothetical protein
MAIIIPLSSTRKKLRVDGTIVGKKERRTNDEHG